MKKLFFALAIAILSITSAAAQKIGHVNSQKVLDTLPSRRAAITEISMLQDMGVREMTEMDSTLQTYYMEYEKNKSVWSALVRESYENKIRNYTMRMQEREQQIDGQLNQLSSALNQKSLDVVKKAVSTVSELKKLNYIIDESVLLYNSGGTDITPDVIKEALKLDAANK